jgi:amino acid adenylation domain-containing protein/non-ribosomal peptide synthase protein (TIGR01720 family)
VSRERTGFEVAIIGLAGRFPGAPDAERFWRNLREGVESITVFSREELSALGVDPQVASDPRFVPAVPALDGIELFDAAFFGLNPREAEGMDPQQRILLELAWAALEDAGYAPGNARGAVGVYVGSSTSQYMLANLLHDPASADLDDLQAAIWNDKDYVATRISYELDLEGPSVAVQTACSTSLVAVHLACQGLLDGDCDLALAGGISLHLHGSRGYFWQKDGILSRDGHCRAFDKRAEGTVFGSGAGLVILKRLEDALADGDLVRAVVLGSAINNDGASKVGFTAPRAEGQAKVIRAALGRAEVDPATISYVEAHGTGTPLGDPIEIEALNRAFRLRGTGSCALGAVKTNVGHLNTAAGVAGLIKTVLALQHREIPPSLWFERPNPRIDFAGSPFYVNTRLAAWPAGEEPRRAGVSAFGIGGTNAHVVLEEAPPESVRPPSPRPAQLLVLSARNAASLERATDDLARFLRERPEANLADVAFTLQAGRRAFEHRRVLVARGAAGAAEALAGRDPERLLTHAGERPERSVAFLFPGQGAQHPDMARGLYAAEPVFRQQVDRGAELLRPHLGLDLRTVLFPPAGEEETAAARLERTELAQPALFVVEHALARLWMEWGVKPAALLGHSVGEYVAAVLAEVFTFEDALALVAVRGRLMQRQAPGAMLSVPLPLVDLLPRLPRELSVAAVNGPRMVVVSGPSAVVAELEEQLAAEGVEGRRLHTSHAFHSHLLEPAIAPFRDEVARVLRREPKIPFLSNVTGTWITAEEATDPGYWARHLRQTVRFGDGLAELFRDPERVLLEVGPGRTLVSLVREHPERPAGMVVVASLRHPREEEDDAEALLGAFGRLWLAGVQPDWTGHHRTAPRRRLALPTYAFDRRRFWKGPEGPVLVRRQPMSGEGSEPPREEPARPPVAPGYGRPFLGTAWQAPSGALEERVAAVWEELLGIAGIGVHDDFLELGGHSLLATRLVARLEEELRVELSVRELFAAPTVARLARLLGERGAGSGTALAAPALPGLVPDLARRGEPFPLTEVQQAYWIGRSGTFELGNVATHVYTELEGEGLDLERLEAVFRRLIERHDMLRAVFLPDGRQQVLAEMPPWRIPVLDLGGRPAAEVERELDRVRREASHQVLPSDRWPLFDLRVTRLSPARVRLHLGIDFLIADAWSLALLTREWLVLWNDPQAALPPLEITFRDYVLAEAALQETPQHRRALEHWRGRLAGLPPGPDLPLARDPAEVTRPRFVRRSARLEAEAWQQLKGRAAAAGLTPSALLLAAFAEVLTAWSRSPRFLLTLTLFRRLPLHPQVDSVVGDFTSLTLLEVDNRGSEPFRRRARHLQERLMEDLDHRSVSGLRVLRELAHASGGRAPRVPVVFTSILGMPETGAAAAAPPLETVWSVSQTPQVWLDHQVTERGGALDFNWDAVEELFPPALLDDLFAAYTHLLGRLAGGDEAWDGRPHLLPESQSRQRETANATAAAVPDLLLHDLFLARAAERPEAPAVLAPGRAMSYGELRRRANALARRLRALGARPDHLIAVVMEKGWEQVVAVLAILEAGGAYLPVDPALPPERVLHLLERGGVEIALTQPRIASGVRWPAEVRWLAVTEGDATDEPVPLEPLQDPGHLAYVIFTSGSTGLPKGVMIEHRGAVNTILDVNRRFGIGPDDRVLGLSSLSFDLSVWDLFGILGAGGAVVLPEPAAHRNPARWRELLERERVTVWNSVPALMEMMAEHASGLSARLPESLRLVMMSGDWIPVPLPDRIRSLAASRIEVISLGGATEASIWSIFHSIGEVDPAWASIPYGQPMANQRFHVLDEALQERPDWVPGQLFIAGAGLARGYWRDPEKTAASFVPHPRTGERLYRTGDLGRYRPDGTLEFLGREDFQVKVQGYRIELGEIEAALLAVAEVRAAVVSALGDRHRKRLVAWVAGGGGAAGEGALRRSLGERLPAYMIPAAFVFLDALPLTANGKVDRGALPLPGEERASAPARASATAFADSRVELLAGIWAEVLGVPKVGPHDNFFALGGDSILSIQVVARANRAGLALSPEQIFEHPTLAELAEQVDPGPVAPGPVMGPVVGPVPLTPIQLWFFEHGFDAPHHWNQAIFLELRRPFAAPLLRQALEAVVTHHDALRLRFARGAAGIGGWRQLNAAEERTGLAVLDLAALPAERQTEALEAAAGALQGSLDLVRGPLLRSALFQRGAGRTDRLLLLFHHLIVDGLSWRIVLEDLGAAYDQFSRGLSAALPPKTASFRRWAERLAEHAWAGGHEDELPYWLAAPRARVVPLPLDLPGAEAENTEASVQSLAVELSEEETERLLREVPTSHRTHIQEVLLTALARALAPWAGPGPLLVDVETHGREGIFPDLDISRTVGWFTAVYPLFLEIDPEAGAGAALAAVKEQVRQVPRAGVGYGILRYLSPRPEVAERLAILPPAEIAFNYLGQFDQAVSAESGLAPSAESTGPWNAPHLRRRHALFVHGRVAGGRLTIVWVYSEKFHQRSTIEGLAAAFLGALREILHGAGEGLGLAGLAPSDFPLAALDRAELEAAFGAVEFQEG